MCLTEDRIRRSLTDNRVYEMQEGANVVFIRHGDLDVSGRGPMLVDPHQLVRVTIMAHFAKHDLFHVLAALDLHTITDEVLEALTMGGFPLDDLFTGAVELSVLD